MGKKIAADLKGGEILALVGELGAGKTTFVQGLAEGLGIKGRVISPTFILMRKYDASDKDFYHVDLYRLEENVGKEIVNLGLTDVWEKSDSIVVVEWAEKARTSFPKATKWINFDNMGEGKRKITIK